MIEPHDISSWWRLVERSESTQGRTVAATATLGAHLGTGNTHSAAETIMAAYRIFVRHGEIGPAHEWLDSAFVRAVVPFLCQRHEFFSAWVHRLRIRDDPRRPEEANSDSSVQAGSPKLVDEANFSPWAEHPEAANISADAFRHRVQTTVPKRWLSAFPDGYESATTLGVHSLLAMSDSRSRDNAFKYNAATFAVRGAWDLDLPTDDILRVILDRRVVIRSVTLGVQE